jgi:hypothetical protein
MEHHGETVASTILRVQESYEPKDRTTDTIFTMGDQGDHFEALLAARIERILKAPVKWAPK